jgi:hypothetical protein
MEHARNDEAQPTEHGKESCQPHEGCCGYPHFAFFDRGLSFGIHLFVSFTVCGFLLMFIVCLLF